MEEPETVTHGGGDIEYSVGGSDAVCQSGSCAVSGIAESGSFRVIHPYLEVFGEELSVGIDFRRIELVGGESTVIVVGSADGGISTFAPFLSAVGDTGIGDS